MAARHHQSHSSPLTATLLLLLLINVATAMPGRSRSSSSSWGGGGGWGSSSRSSGGSSWGSGTSSGSSWGSSSLGSSWKTSAGSSSLPSRTSWGSNNPSGSISVSTGGLFNGGSAASGSLSDTFRMTGPMSSTSVIKSPQMNLKTDFGPELDAFAKSTLRNMNTGSGSSHSLFGSSAGSQTSDIDSMFEKFKESSKRNKQIMSGLYSTPSKSNSHKNSFRMTGPMSSTSVIEAPDLTIDTDWSKDLLPSKSYQKTLDKAFSKLNSNQNSNLFKNTGSQSSSYDELLKKMKANAIVIDSSQLKKINEKNRKEMKKLVERVNKKYGAALQSQRFRGPSYVHFRQANIIPTGQTPAHGGKALPLNVTVAKGNKWLNYFRKWTHAMVMSPNVKKALQEHPKP